MGRPRRAFSILLITALVFGLGCDDPVGGDSDAGSQTDGGVADAWAGDGGRDGFAPGPDAASDGGLPELRDPAASGTHTSTSSTESVTLGANTLPVTLYLPDGAGPFPVIVFTHGFGLSPSLYESYGVHLASWGYVVVMPELPGSMMVPKPHRELKEILRALLDWIDAEGPNPGGPFGGRAAPALLGLAGHSMGGKISLLVSTEDVRPLAVFGVDPVDAAGGPFGGDPVDYPSVTPELMPQITVPLGLLGETVNADGGALGQACAPAADNFAQYYQHATSPALEIEVLGANHMSFLDDPNCGLSCTMCPAGTDDPATTRLVTRRYMTAFFNVFVGADLDYRPYLDGGLIAADVTAGLITTQHKNGL